MHGWMTKHAPERFLGIPSSLLFIIGNTRTVRKTWCERDPRSVAFQFVVHGEKRCGTLPLLQADTACNGVCFLPWSRWASSWGGNGNASFGIGGDGGPWSTELHLSVPKSHISFVLGTHCSVSHRPNLPPPSIVTGVNTEMQRWVICTAKRRYAIVEASHEPEQKNVSLSFCGRKKKVPVIIFVV